MSQPVDPDEVSDRVGLGAALTQARESAGLTVRALSRRVGIPHTTLGGYFTGRHLPGVAQTELFTKVLGELGITAEADVHRWLAAVGRARAASDRRLRRPDAPYRGLRHFEVDDAKVFFGRGSDTEQLRALIGRLARERGPSGGLAAVVGPSGSGKSSLLRAGLAAALRADGWTCVVVTPGGAPLDALRQAERELETAAGEGEGRVVVIDQFEEVLIGAVDEAKRERFMAELERLLGRVPVVIGLRADFYAAAAAVPVLRAALRHAQVLVGPLDADEVRAVITCPAEAAGATVEPALVELLLAEIRPRDARIGAHDLGALPLLSHALLSTWEHSAGSTLTVADYSAAGGVAAAVQQSADEAYAGLDERGRPLARRLFLRLVTIDGDTAVTRRRVAQAELAAFAEGDAEGYADVVNRFVDRRLLTAAEGTVELSHEALLTAWPRLHRWIDTDRAGLRLHRQITDAAETWRAADRDEALHLRGTRLDLALEWAADPSHAESMTSIERDYLDASATAARLERARAARRTRRLRQLLVAVSVLALVAVGLAAYSARSRSLADQARRATALARDNALSRQVASQALSLLDKDPALAQQLALVAYRIAPTDEARAALVDQTARPVIARRLGAPGATPLAISPDATLAAVGQSDDGSVHLYRLGGRDRPPSPAGVIPGAGSGAQQFAIAFVPGTSLVALGGQSTRVSLWDIAAPAHPRRVAVLQPGFGGAVESIAVSPDGHTLAAGSSGPHPVMLWDITTPSAPRRLPAPAVAASLTVQAVAFNSTGTRLAAVGSGGPGYLWRVRSGRTTLAQPIDSTAQPAYSVAFNPRQPELYVGRGGGVDVYAFRPAQPKLTGHLGADSGLRTTGLAVSPDGTRVAVGDTAGSVQLMTTADGTALSSLTNPAPVTGLGYGRQGAQLYVTAADGALRGLPVAAGSIPVGGGGYNIATSADRSVMGFVTGASGAAVQLWRTLDPRHPRPLGPPITAPAGATPFNGAIALSGDARLLVTGDGTGGVTLWDCRDPARPVPYGRAFPAAGASVESVALSPDGRTLAVGSDDHTATLIDVSDPARPSKLATLKGTSVMLTVAFNRTGRLLAGANADGHTYLWSLTDPRHPVPAAVLGGFHSYVYGVSFSPTSDILAATGADHTTRLWRLTDPRHPHPLAGPLIGPAGYVYSPAFSPDGNTLAVGAEDHTVRVYALDGSTVPQMTLVSAGYVVFAVTYGPHGRSLIASGNGPEATVWSTDVRGYGKRLCAQVGDQITRAEWSLYVRGKAYSPLC